MSYNDIPLCLPIAGNENWNRLIYKEFLYFRGQTWAMTLCEFGRLIGANTLCAKPWLHVLSCYKWISCLCVIVKNDEQSLRGKIFLGMCNWVLLHLFCCYIQSREIYIINRKNYNEIHFFLPSILLQRQWFHYFIAIALRIKCNSISRLNLWTRDGELNWLSNLWKHEKLR